MLVYGDRSLQATARSLIRDLREHLAKPVHDETEYRSMQVEALIRVGELTQGILDLEFQRKGCDDLSETEGLCSRALVACARRLLASSPAEPLSQILSNLEAEYGDSRLTVKSAEGFAFYSLYPESYLASARKFRTCFPDPPCVVIGLRSIGAPLAALVAAVTSPILPILTFRPTGHPFQRKLSLSEALEKRLLELPSETHFLVVDEGPGLSGSSFGAVGDWLEEHGIVADRIHYFPSHPSGLGPEASEKHRKRWEKSHLHLTRFEELLDSGALGELSTLLQGAEDLSGGLWRNFSASRGQSEPPPSQLTQERRKYLVRDAAGKAWLAKFVGLGQTGRRRLERARKLANHGFIPPVGRLIHGFLLQEWLEDARPLSSPSIEALNLRRPLLARLGKYLGILALEFPAPESRRRSDCRALLEMTVLNARESLGADSCSLLERWKPRLRDLERQVRPVEIDGRLQPWEWIFSPSLEVLKTDALDHHDSHDRIGCQDIAWDVAGAIVELSLSPAERVEVLEDIRRTSGVHVDEELVTFHESCYLGFQIGAYSLAAKSARGISEEESRRLARRGAFYERELCRRLGLPHPALRCLSA